MPAVLMALLLLLGLLGLLVLLRSCTRGPCLAPRWPPGPRPLPLLGNLHLLRLSQQDQSLMEVSRGSLPAAWLLSLDPEPGSCHPRRLWYPTPSWGRPSPRFPRPLFLAGAGLIHVPSLTWGRERHPTSQESRWTVQGAGGQEGFLEEAAFEDGLQYSQVWGSEGEG